MLIKITLGELVEIHENNYSDNAKAHGLFLEIVEKLNGDRRAVIPLTMPEFEDYCEATD